MPWDYFDDFGGLTVGLGDPADATTSALAAMQGIGDPEAYAQAAQQAALSSAGGYAGQLTGYVTQGKALINQAVQTFNNGGPTGDQAVSLAANFGATLLNAAGGGSFGTIAKIVGGTIAGVVSGAAVGGPIGAVAGGAIAFAEAAIQSLTGGSVCNPPCEVSQAGWAGMGTAAGDLIAKNVYMWRQTIGGESSQMPVGYALYLAWTQLTPTYGSGVTRNGLPVLQQTAPSQIGIQAASSNTFVDGVDPIVDTVSSKPLTAAAQGLTAVPESCQYLFASYQKVGTCAPYVDTFLGYNEAQRPPQSATVSTPRGPVGQLIFNSLSQKAGGDSFAQLAIARLPPASLLDVPAYAPAGATTIDLNGYDGFGAAGSVPLGYGLGPMGYYATALMTVLGHLTVGANDLAITNELQAQVASIQATSVTPVVLQPEFYKLIAYYQALSVTTPSSVGAGTSGGLASASVATQAAVAVTGTAAAVAAGAAVYTYATGRSAWALAKAFAKGFRL